MYTIAYINERKDKRPRKKADVNSIERGVFCSCCKLVPEHLMIFGGDRDYAMHLMRSNGMKNEIGGWQEC